MNVKHRRAEHRIVRHDGFDIEVIARGKGPALVLLPSVGRSAEDFDELAALIAEDGFRVLAIQPRGMGASNGPLDNRPSLADFTDDVAAVVRAENEGRPLVIGGHAFGSFVARLFAARHPSLTRGTIIIAGSPGKTLKGASTMTVPAMAALAQCSNLSLPDEQRLAYLYEAFFFRDNDARVWLGGWYPETKLVQRAAFDATPTDDYFAAGTAPILDVQAADDTLAIPEHADVLRTLLGSRVTTSVIPRAGHALVPEQPRAVADAVAGWMRALP